MPISIALPLFVVAGATVAFVAPRMTGTTEALSQHTKFGKSIVGTILLGASTSLPGFVVTITATLNGQAELAVANSIGGVAAQTASLGVADLVYRKGELEVEQRSPAWLSQIAVLIGLLALPLIAIGGWPNVTVGRMNPASLVLIGGYAAGVVMLRRQPKAPDGKEAGGEEDPFRPEEDLAAVWRRYGLLLILMVGAGYAIGSSVQPISRTLGFTSVAAGGLLTAVTTSSPEITTAITAAKREQLELAVGDIVGGNNFDLLFVALADLTLPTSLYRMTGPTTVLLIGVTLLLNALLLLNFVRQKPDRWVAPESIAMIFAYLVLAVLLATLKA